MRLTADAARGGPRNGSSLRRQLGTSSRSSKAGRPQKFENSTRLPMNFSRRVVRPDRYELSGPLCWHALDGEWVVYSTATGSLQHLDSLSAVVLATLEDRAATAAEVIERLASETETALTGDVKAGVEAVLDRLQRNGFLQCRNV